MILLRCRNHFYNSACILIRSINVIFTSDVNPGSRYSGCFDLRFLRPGRSGLRYKLYVRYYILDILQPGRFAMRFYNTNVCILTNDFLGLNEKMFKNFKTARPGAKYYCYQSKHSLRSQWGVKFNSISGLMRTLLV